MSTVAYRGGVLAADSRAYGGKYAATPGAKRKLYRLPDGSILGVVSGIVGFSERFAAWLESGAVPDKFGDGEQAFKALLVRPSCKVFLYVDSLYPSGPIDSEFYAVGSGDDYALGAMACGCSAVQAVEIAARFDPHTGGEVLELKVA